MALTLRFAPLLLGAAILLSACERDTTPDMTAVQSADADAHGFSAPTPATRAANAVFAKTLALNDERDFAAATQGFIARDDNLHIIRPNGSTIWRPADYAFIKDTAPDSVNPSLWRQEKLNNIHGLFKVNERVFQMRIGRDGAARVADKHHQAEARDRIAHIDDLAARSGPDGGASHGLDVDPVVHPAARLWPVARKDDAPVHRPGQCRKRRRCRRR